MNALMTLINDTASFLIYGCCVVISIGAIKRMKKAKKAKQAVKVIKSSNKNK